MIALFLLTLLPVQADAPQSATGPAADWIELFDGSTLAGWNYLGTPGGATVEDGVLVLQSTGPGKQAGHLFYVGGDPSEPQLFRNFELEIVSRARPGSNSGVFFHTTPRIRNKVGHLADGYEVQLNNVAAEKHKTGSLYAVEIVEHSPVDESNWFTMRVRVEDKRIQVFVENEQVVDYTEPDNVDEQRPKARKGRVLRDEGGLIALQAHDTGSVWYVKSLRVRPLPSGE